MHKYFIYILFIDVVNNFLRNCFIYGINTLQEICRGDRDISYRDDHNETPNRSLESLNKLGLT
jgi:hypothetical protein